MKYVTHTESGEGLLFTECDLAFVIISRKMQLYKVMTTKPEEVSIE